MSTEGNVINRAATALVSLFEGDDIMKAQSAVDETRACFAKANVPLDVFCHSILNTPKLRMHCLDMTTGAVNVKKRDAVEAMLRRILGDGQP